VGILAFILYKRHPSSCQGKFYAMLSSRCQSVQMLTFVGHDASPNDPLLSAHPNLQTPQFLKKENHRSGVRPTHSSQRSTLAACSDWLQRRLPAPFRAPMQGMRRPEAPIRELPQAATDHCCRDVVCPLPLTIVEARNAARNLIHTD
jgi:hypothetical protein